VRALCPIHHGNERHLSIAAWSPDMDEEDEQLAGWGHCHSAACGATVLVQEWNPRAAQRILGKPIAARTPRHAITAEQREQAEDWQLAELAALNKLYPRMQAQLAHPRAQAYLKERGLQEMQLLLTSLGMGYIPPTDEWNGLVALRRAGKTVKVDLKKWTDRIVFPYTTREGERGFLGRSLYAWEPGIDENAHKRLLKEREVIRWKKTYKSGYIHAEAISQHKHLYVCEGGFDLLPLLHAGIENALAIAGTEIDAHAFPASVRTVTLAFDADVKDGSAITRACEKLGHAGIVFDFLPPPDDGQGKDWSERYRLHGFDGLSAILRPSTATEDEWPSGLIIEPPLCATCLDAGQETPALDDAADDDFMYCQAHHPTRIAPKIHTSAGQPRIIEGMSDAAYMAMRHQEAQEQQARTIAAAVPGVKKRTA